MNIKIKKGTYSTFHKKMIYSQNNFDARSTESFNASALIGTENLPRYGIRGKTKLSEFINFPDSLPIDYMHLLCLGIFKNIFKKWFDSKNKQSKFYIGS